MMYIVHKIDFQRVFLHKNVLEKCFVNGMENALISKAVVPKRKPNQNNEQLQKVKGNGFD